MSDSYKKADLPPDGLLTSEDLFGDMVDAPIQGTPPRPARGAPIRVQVADSGGRARLVGGAQDDETAGLLDALDASTPGSGSDGEGRRDAGAQAPPAADDSGEFTIETLLKRFSGQ